MSDSDGRGPAATAPRGDVVGVGYEGRDILWLLRSLRDRAVVTVVDVRLNPVSRKRGFSKRALAASLQEHGIAYVHLPALGNPQDNRAGFSATAAREVLAAHARFAEVLASTDARSALEEVESLQELGRVALLCFEHDESQCHRHLVLNALAMRAGS